MKKSLLMIVLLLISITICAQKNIKVAAAANLRGVFEEIKENYEKPAPKVMMITAYADDENYNEAMKLGADDFLTKPVDFVNLKEKLKKFIS